jgi:hypothetical protein
MAPSVIENFVVGIITTVVVAIVTWFWGRFRRSTLLNRRAAFFGISPGESSLAVINQKPDNVNTMSHADVQTLVEVVKLTNEVGSKLEIAPFDQILEPAGNVTEFCLGGPDSNRRTKVHLETFLHGVILKPYAPGDQDNIAIATKDRIYRYKKNESEYAILARFYPNATANPVILICGQTARSNRGAIHYLIEHYDHTLRKKYGNKRQFCLIIGLQSPVTYGYKSAFLESDLTDIAFVPFTQ